ncbi:MAG TPA: ribonuclease III [Gammaproteobacteria bacterium]|nr:ribonuclease III [Gammaproteobacteria bacterium]
MRLETLLADRLGYEFRDHDLLQRALRHRSSGSRNNERLEFLGDAVLGLIIAKELFHRDRDFNEGDLSRLRASLVNRDALAALAAELSLGEYVDLGPGEMKSGGHRRKSILADTLEALLGAIYLDGGYAAAETAIQRLYRDSLAHLPAPDTLKDAKTRLQEHLQARSQPLPVYEMIEHRGPPHDPVFTVHASIEALSLNVTATGRSRRLAEQKAAGELLDHLIDE